MELWKYENILYACMCLYVYAQVCMCVYTLYVYMNMILINARICVCVCAYIHVGAHACICLHANAYVHTFKGVVPTYVHTYICTYFEICWLCTCMCRIYTYGCENVRVRMWVHLNISTACGCDLCAYVFIYISEHVMLM